MNPITDPSRTATKATVADYDDDVAGDEPAILGVGRLAASMMGGRGGGGLDRPRPRRRSIRFPS